MRRRRGEAMHGTSSPSPCDHAGPASRLVVGTTEQIEFLKAVADDAELAAQRSRFVLHVAVLMALDYAARGSGLAHPGKETLARRTGGDVKSVWRAIEALQARGYLSDTGARKGRAHVFELRIPNRAPTPENAEANPGAHALNVDPNRAPVSPKSGAGVREIGRPCPDTIEEPSKEPSEEPIPPNPQGETCAGWLEFIEAWRFDDPTEATTGARRQFAALSEADKAEAIRCAPHYRAECEKRQRRRKFAATWLSARGWEPFAPSEPREAAPAFVFVEADSVEGRAWRDFKARNGERWRPLQTRAGFGRYCPSRFPPAAEEGALDSNAPMRMGDFSRTSDDYRRRERTEVQC